MSSLAELPALVGFFSYSREDDEGSGGKLSKLRERIQEELRLQLGRTRKDFRLWQDKAAIAHAKSAQLDPSSTEVALRVEKFCTNICRALEQEWLSPEERREAEARRAAEAERRPQQEAEIKQRADEGRTSKEG
jgi:hypothetical protein